MSSSMRTIALVAACAVLSLSVLNLAAARPNNVVSESQYIGVPRGWVRGARVGADTEVPIIFAIRHRNTDKLEAILLDISHPKSANFGKHMSLEEVRELTADYAAAGTVLRFLRGAGVAAERVVLTPNADFVHVTLSGAEAERVFGTSFFHWTHPQRNYRQISALDYKLPQNVRDAIDFVSASGMFRSANPGRPASRPVPLESLEAGAKAGVFPPAGFVGPQLIWSTYGIANPMVDNQAATQSVYENLQQSFAPADLASFQQTFNLAQTPVANVIGPNNASDCFAEPGNCVEANLDVQYIFAIAQNAPLTFWSIASSDQTPFLDWIIAVANDANAPLVHSVSYGDVEQEGSSPTVMKNFNTQVQKLGVRGITVMVASGDDGVANFPARTDPTQCGFFPSYPASCPYITAVGATMGPENNATETACTSALGGGITTGGGFSTIFSQPSYQSSVVNAYLQNGPNMPPTSQFASTGRGYPDVAVMGHNYVDVVGGNFSAGSGTSASAPVFAGMITLINAQRLDAGKNAIGFLNQILYNLHSTNPAVFNDITVGENNCCAGDPGQQTCCQYGFTATTGWDPLSGLGSVNFPALSAALVALP